MKKYFFLICLTGSALTWAESGPAEPERKQEGESFCANKDLWQHYPQIKKEACLQAAKKCMDDTDTTLHGWRQTFYRCVLDKLDVNAAGN